MSLSDMRAWITFHPSGHTAIKEDTKMADSNKKNESVAEPELEKVTGGANLVPPEGIPEFITPDFPAPAPELPATPLTPGSETSLRRCPYCGRCFDFTYEQMHEHKRNCGG